MKFLVPIYFLLSIFINNISTVSSKKELRIMSDENRAEIKEYIENQKKFAAYKNFQESFILLIDLMPNENNKVVTQNPIYRATVDKIATVASTALLEITRRFKSDLKNSLNEKSIAELLTRLSMLEELIKQEQKTEITEFYRKFIKSFFES